MAQHAAPAVPPVTRGWRLRIAREWAGLDAQEAAEQLEIHRGTISRWEHDDDVPIRTIYMREMAMLYGVSVEWLLTGTAPQPEPPKGGRKQGKGQYTGIEGPLLDVYDTGRLAAVA